MAAGCHTIRPTQESIIKTGFRMVKIDHHSMRDVPPIVRPSIRGIAIKV